MKRCAPLKYQVREDIMCIDKSMINQYIGKSDGIKTGFNKTEAFSEFEEVLGARIQGIDRDRVAREDAERTLSYSSSPLLTKSKSLRSRARNSANPAS